MAGRPRKPVAQKKAEGTYRLDRDLGIKIPTLDKMPAPDPKLNLSNWSTDFWYSYGNQLISFGLLGFLDLVLFGRLCYLYDQRAEFLKDIKKNGYVQVSEKSGFEMARPIVGMLRTCEMEMLKIEDRFGLSPNARAKIPAQKQEEGNPFKEMLEE